MLILTSVSHEKLISMHELQTFICNCISDEINIWSYILYTYQSNLAPIKIRATIMYGNNDFLILIKCIGII